MQIKTGTGRDDSSYDVKNPMGGKRGGSTTNLSHSISGSSANQNGAGGKSK